MADNKETCILGTLVLVPQWRLRKKNKQRETRKRKELVIFIFCFQIF